MSSARLVEEEVKSSIQQSLTDSDETDSSFHFKKKQPVIKVENEETDESFKHAQIAKRPENIEKPPIIIQKASSYPTKLVHVKPVKSVSTVSQSPNRNRIDKIVDNLKINILQQQKKQEIENNKDKDKEIPKVSPVLHSITINTKPNVSIINKNKTLNKFQTDLLNNLKTFKLDDDDDDDDDYLDDLTNLNWLNKFDLSTTGLAPLSPPQSPPLPSVQQVPIKIQPVKTPIIKPISKQTLLTKPIVNPCVKNLTSTYLNDESDGCHSRLITQSQTDIKDLIKPWLPVQTKTSNQRPPYSFSCLTFLAIEASEKKRLSVKEIYSWITQSFPYYGSVPSGSWKNSIRHNLSYNQCFTKVDKNLLTMRDFSGKGSLWCINPEYRQILIESLLKTPTHEQHQLASIPYLQDITEVPKVVLLNNPLKSPKPSAEKLNVNSRSSRISASKPAILNPKIASKFNSASLTTLNSLQSQAPRITNVAKTNTISKSSSNISNESNMVPCTSSSNLSISDNCTELDAVNALLSMKSRASSMPITAGLCYQAEKLVSKDANSSDNTPKKGRRKQLFKPPTKNTNLKRLEDDEEHFEIDTDDELEGLNDDDQMNFDDSEEEEIYTSKNKTFKNEAKKTSKTKKHKKLLVKFSSFKSKATNENKQTKESVNFEENEDESNDEKSLQIDESFNSENEEKQSENTAQINKRKCLDYYQGNDDDDDDEELEPGEIKRSKTSITLNPLLELSRAASLIEDQN